MSGGAFDGAAEQYDRHRPAYPPALLDRVWELAGLEAGDAVLEIGCGTGQLMQSLVTRGLRVTAVEPGARLIARARERLAGSPDVCFIGARLEAAPLPEAAFAAAFSASAIHWVDPDIGWPKLAAALVDGGTLALISYFGLHHPVSADDQRDLREAIAAVAPDFASSLPADRTLEELQSGVVARISDISAGWSWLGDCELGRPSVPGLFGEVGLVTVAAHFEHSGDELCALLGTMSYWAGRPAEQLDALRVEINDLHQRLGRPIRSSTVACALMARRHERTTRAVHAATRRRLAS